VRELGEARAGNQVLSRYQFAHHLFQRYLYNELGVGERRLLHGEIARCLEDIFGEQAPQIAVQLAFHYGRANLPQSAARYLRLAGDQARSSYANQEAIRHYTELLPLLPSPSPELFDVLAARAAVYELIGRPSEQHADVEAMLSLARQLGDQARHCDGLLALADYHLGKEHVLAQEPAEAALGIARHLDDPVREGAALRRLGWLEWFKEDYPRSRQLLELAVEKFHAAGQDGEVATALHTLSLALGNLGEHEGALMAAQEAVELSRAAGDRRQEATGLRRVAIAHMDQDRHEHALPFAEQALAMHQEMGDAVAEAAGHNVLGIIQAWLSDFGPSEDHLRRSLELAHLAGDTNAITNAIGNLLEMHYRRRGEYEAGLRLVEGSLEDAVAAENEWLVGLLHFFKGYELEILGCPERALSTYEIALSIFDRVAPRSVWATDIASCQSRCHADLGHLDLAREAISKATAIAESVGDPISIAFTQLVRAYVILLDGDPTLATTGLDLLSDAIRFASKGKRPWLLENCLNTAARLHLALGHAEEALPLARDLIRLIDRVPIFYEPQQFLYTLAQVFGALGQDDEAMGYLRRAYDWITIAAGKMQDAELRSSWLEKHPRNREILAAAAERGIS
jgi:tetratricopeptide (TPR) repeat protein